MIMKNILKLLLVVFVVFQSCEETQAPIYDGSQTLVYFDTPTSSLDVEINNVGSVDVVIGSSTLSNQDRQLNVDLIADQTDTNSANYSLPATVTIPANQYTGVLTVSGTDFDLTTAPEIITIALSGNLTSTVITDAQHTITIKQICPIPATYFVGSYLLEQVSPQIPGNGFTLSDGSVVDVFIPNNSNGNPITTRRSFSTEAYPTFCGGSFFDFEIDLVCNEVVVPLGNTTCSCAGDFDDYFGPAITNETYNLSDDMVILFTFSDDTKDVCGGGTNQMTYRLTKQ